MSNKIKISEYQLSLLLIAFIFGTSSVISIGVNVKQDIWIAYMIGWIGGYVLIGSYAYLSKLHPSQTLIGMLKDAFGKHIGSLIGLFYIGYFMHLASLVARDMGEYMVNIEYHETPIIFIIICLTLVAIFALKKGLEVIARANQLFAVLSIVFTLFLFFVLIKNYKIQHMLPFFESDCTKIIKTGFIYLTFPFGETVSFLMIFKYVNKKRNLAKVSFASITIAGILLLFLILQMLFTLCPLRLERDVFPINTATSRIPNLVIDPLVSLNLIFAGGLKYIICLYAATQGITEIFKLDDYRLFIFPICTIVVPLSLWIHNNLPEMIQWSVDIYKLYAIPFQIFIPLLLIIISYIKRRN